MPAYPHRPHLFLTLGLLLGACRPGAVEQPFPNTSLRLHIIPADSTAHGLMEFTVVVANTSGRPLTLHFPTTCQLGLYIVTAEGQRAYSSPQACGDMVTEMEIPPRDSVQSTWRLPVRPTPGEGSWTLGPGEYRVYGMLNPGAAFDADRPVTRTVAFTLR